MQYPRKDRSIRGAFVVLSSIALCAAPALASGPWLITDLGVRTFVISAQITEAHGPYEPFKVLFGMRGTDYPSEAQAEGRVVIGPGLEWVAGDSVHVGHVSPAWRGAKDHRWPVTLRASRPGTIPLHAVMHAAVGGGRIDEMDLAMDIAVDSMGIHAGLARIVREETVRHGQRYRCTARYLVPIDRPEDVVEDDIKVKPKATLKIPGSCPDSPPDGCDVVFVVFVDRSGGIVSLEPLPELTSVEAAKPAIIAAAARALRGWTFFPAMAGSRHVADWAHVRVHVTR